MKRKYLAKTDRWPTFAKEGNVEFAEVASRTWIKDKRERERESEREREREREIWGPKGEYKLMRKI